MTMDPPDFDRVVTVRDACRAMLRFVAARSACAGPDRDGRTGDPAALQDYLDALAEVEAGGRAAPDFRIVVEDDLADADRIAIEVRLVLADGSERWCFFMTPAALARCGDWIPGTRIPMHRGELHMFVVGECTAEIIAAVLGEVARDGELLRRTRPC